ncbi:tripartite tricarboxylate transporter substrate binding protein [Bordetella genomosp. 13]|uniref:ABC transporter substrate-binding protein n=1 Tax=Bordetella genomosp. 13 TaxID=463040 RepID=A0A1W6ZAC6_9BORD|nr:tripartite tricarboxylate transporter substrate binding protein [Bordetella genomosp. 13]ARP94202.1 ABC transporter substrate-binding protein [Bordetella genomosp. 13]
MKTLRNLLLGLLTGSAAFAATAAQTYPVKPVEVVVAYQPGGGSDNTARAIADVARHHLPESVYVSNKPGASGSIGWSYVLAGKPDGYKVLLMNPEMLFVPLMGIGKATIADFQPIARFTDDPSSITVRADAPWNTIEEFIAYARANPEAVTISNAGNGTIPHLAAAALADSIGATFTHVPYQGSSPAIMGLMSGDVKATTVAYAELKQHVESGKLKTLAVMSAQRLQGLPQVPTFKERGHDLQFSVWRGIGLPKGAPEEALSTWREVARKVYETPAFQKSVVSQNLTLAWADTPEFSADIARQDQAFKELMKKLNLKQ